MDNNLYVVNVHGYYFKILPFETDGSIFVDKSNLKGCDFFDTIEAMYQHVCKVQDLELDEVEHFEICIKKLDKSYVESDHRGGWFDIELRKNQTIESYITTYLM